jgi:Flp pilus assembly protein TadG
MIPVWSKFRNALRAYRSAHGGNVAITFALATLPIIATVGFAVDYSHANSVKVAMQSALDSTALMLSKEAATDTSSQLQQNAVKYFTALFTRPEATNVTITASYTSSGGTSLVVNGSAVVPTALLGIIGYSNITVSGSSTAKWGSNLLRVALVLDNTGSMADSGKMTALISATKSLLTQLQSAATNNGDVYVSIVPFVKDVNLGASNYNSDYIYWGTVAQDATLSDNNSWDANNGSCSSPYSSSQTRSSCLSHASCSISGNNTQSSCTSAGTCSVSGYTSQSSCTATGTCSISSKTSQSSCTGAGTCSNPSETTQSSCTGNKACSKSGYSSKNSCQNANGTWATGSWTAGIWTVATWTQGVWTAATWTPDNHNTWNGCVMDRGNSNAPDTINNYDTNAASPSAVPLVTSSLYPAEQYSSCPQAVMGLSYNWTGMTSLVNAMSPNGNTNQAIGLQLGWMTLVGGGGMFNVPAMQTGYTYSQVIILLTDGLNTQNRWTSSQGSIDAREQLTCTNFKNASTTQVQNIIYTIQVNTGGDPTSTLLQSCASTSDKFFLLTSASQIMSVFTQIGSNLTQLRVAK